MHHVYWRVSSSHIVRLKPNAGLLVRSISMAAKSRTYNVRLTFSCDNAVVSPSQTSQDAIDALNSLQTPYNIIEARKKAGIRPDARSIEEMKGYLGRIGYSVRHPRLEPLHVSLQSLIL